MKFYDDEPIECENCGTMIYAGDTALEFDDKFYCCEECVKEAMYEKYSDQVGTHHLLTANDHEEIYGEMMYEESRGK